MKQILSAWYYAQGSLYAVRNRPDRAVECFSKAIVLVPLFWAALDRRATLLMGLSRYDEAVADLGLLVHKYAMNAQYRRALGFCHALAGDTRRAFQDYDIARQLSPHNYRISIDLGLIYARLERYNRAVGHFNDALALHAQLRTQKRKRRALFRELGRGALRLFNEDYAVIHFHRGMTLLLQGDNAAAFEDFGRAYRLGVRDPYFLATYYRMMVRREIFDEAFDVAHEMVRSHPALKSGYYYRGIEHFRKDRYAESLRDFEAAVRRGLENSDVFQRLGDCLARLGEHSAAIGRYTQAIVLEPANASAYLERGCAFAALSDLRKAAEDFKRSIALTPSAHAHYRLGETLMRLGQRNEGVDHLVTAADLGHRQAAEALERMGITRVHHENGTTAPSAPPRRIRRKRKDLTPLDKLIREMGLDDGLTARAAEAAPSQGEETRTDVSDLLRVVYVRIWIRRELQARGCMDEEISMVENRLVNRLSLRHPVTLQGQIERVLSGLRRKDLLQLSPQEVHAIAERVRRRYDHLDV